MSRSVRFIQLAIAVALGLGLLAVFAFALFGDALRQEANAPTGPVSTPSPEKLAASVASAQADAPKLLPPLDVRPVVYEETAGDQRMDRLEQSVGRLAGLLEEQATQAASPRAALDHPAPAFAPLPIGQLAPAYAAAGAFVQPGPAARLEQAGPFTPVPAIPRIIETAGKPPNGPVV